MTRYLLDTNIISNVIKPEPSESLLAWMGAQKDDDLFIASLTVAEIRRGILEKPKGKKRSTLKLGSLARKGRRRCSLAASYRSTRKLASCGRD